MDELDQNFKLTEDNSVIEKKRPAFLLVLCILTFVSSGFGLIMGLVNFAGFNDVQSQFQNASVGSSSDAIDILNNIDIAAIQKIQDWANILGILASILCLAGAIIMFKMKKIGFLPYVLGHVVAIYAAFVGIGILKEIASIMPVEAVGDVMQLTGAIMMVVTVIFSIAFIIMYGVNLKHLK